MHLYKEKEKEYFSNSRHDLIRIVQEEGLQNVKVLEVGAGGGYTLLQLKKLGIAKETIGFELFQLPGTVQQHEDINQFIIGNIENTETLPFEYEYFDLVLFPDVLEHLIDPWATLTKIEPYLKKGGMMLISVPNFRELSVMRKVFLQADFQYSSEGILDKTHLRFFCKKNAIQLTAHIPSLKIKKVFSSFEKNSFAKKRLWLNRLSLGLMKDFLTTQYLILIYKQQ